MPGKEGEVKLYLFVDDRVFYVETLRALEKLKMTNPLELIDQFSKGARSLLKALSVTSSHANNKQSEKNIMKRTSFAFKSKILAIHPTKDMKDK